ncbi:LysR family transcriptional regulator [Fibrobacterota bacterium]
MNIRDLEYLAAVAELRHFKNAAYRCCVSQPTLSGQVKKLEEELNVKIFVRDRYCFEVTPIGEKIVNQVNIALMEVYKIKRLAEKHMTSLQPDPCLP